MDHDARTVRRGWRLPITAALIMLLATVLGAVINLLTNALPESWTWTRNVSLLAVIACVLALLAAALTLLIERKKDTPDSRKAHEADESILNDLAKAVESASQIESMADRLSVELPVRWRLARRQVASRTEAALAAGGAASFTPLPKLSKVTYGDVADGGGLGELYKVYGGLASGRLVLAGPAGAGKTSAAFLLLSRALKQRRGASREDRLQIPVPVMLTLRDWAPDAELFIDWVVRQLSQSYRLFRGRHGRARAKNLLIKGSIAVFLDGFDEADASVRPLILRKLNDATFRVILLSRALEAVVSRKRAPWRRALGLELEPLKAEDAIAYLLRCELDDPLPPAWQAVVNELSTNPSGRLAKALEVPLLVGLLPEAYGNNGAVNELLDANRFPTAVSIRDWLLDRMVRSAYESLCTGESAERTLRFLARRLKEKESQRSDLEWWQIPTWMPGRLRAAILALPAAVVIAIATVAAFGPPLGLLIASMMGGAIYWQSLKVSEDPLPTTGWRDIINKRTVLPGLFVSGVNLTILPFAYRSGVTEIGYTLIASLLAGFVTVFLMSPARDMVSGLPHAIVPEIMHESLRAKTAYVKKHRVVATRVVGPIQVWRHHAYTRPAIGLTFGLMTGAWSGLASAVGGQEETAFSTGVATAVMFGFYCATAANLALATALATIYLRLTVGVPLRLISFLEDARKHNLIRISGQVYQFRHVTLRDRLASHTEKH